MYYNNVEKIIMWERVIIKIIFDEKKEEKKISLYFV